MRITRLTTAALALAFVLTAAFSSRLQKTSAAAECEGDARPRVAATFGEAEQQYRARNNSPDRRARAAASNVTPAAQTPEEAKVTLKTTGFEPAEIARAAGSFRLRVVNASGEQSLTFRVLKATGQKRQER